MVDIKLEKAMYVFLCAVNLEIYVYKKLRRTDPVPR